MVTLGLDKRLAPVDLPVLRAQIQLVVTAIINGLPKVIISAAGSAAPPVSDT
jgi:hypothetical protein